LVTHRRGVAGKLTGDGGFTRTSSEYSRDAQALGRRREAFRVREHERTSNLVHTERAGEREKCEEEN